MAALVLLFLTVAVLTMFLKPLSVAHWTSTFLIFFQVFFAFLEVCLKCFHFTVILVFFAVGFLMEVISIGCLILAP